MADPKTNLRVSISADIKDIKAGLAVLRRDLAGVGTAGRKAGSDASNGLGAMHAGAKRLRGVLTGIFAGFSVGALFKGVLDNTREAEDAIAQLEAGLKSTKGIAGVTSKEIVALAQSLQQVTTFGDDAIVSMASILATFTNIRGTVFKDTIPAILDLSARLGTDLTASAIQVGKALNDPVKGLAALGKAGIQFTADQKKLVEGFIKLGDVQSAQRLILDELTTQMGGSARAKANTFAGAIDQLKNAFGDLLEGDSGSGGLKGAKTAIQNLTETLNDPSVKSGFAAVIEGMALVFEFAVRAIDAVNGLRQAVVDALALDANKSYLGLLAKRAALEDDLANVEKNGLGRLNLAFGGRSGEVNPLSIALKGSTDQAAKLRAELASVDALLNKRRILADPSKVNTAAQINAGGPVVFEDPPPPPPSLQAKPLADTKKAVKGVVDQFAIARDAIARQLEEIARQLEAGKVSLAAYYEEKRKLQEQDIDLQIQSAQQEAKNAKTSEQQSRAMTDIVKLQRERAEIGPAVAREQAKAEQELALELEKVHQKILTLNGQTAEVTRAQLDSEFKGLLDRLQAEGRDAEMAVIKGFIDASVVKAQIQDFETKAAAILATLQAAESSLGAQAGGGLIPSVEAEQRLDEERTKALEKLRLLRQSVKAYYDATKDPSVLAFLQQLDGNLGEVLQSQQLFAQQVKNQAVNSLSGFFSDLATGAKSFKDAFLDMVRSFVAGIAQMIAQKLALKAVEVIAGSFHTGGLVGSGGSTRAVNPMLFGAAPRYHTGGLAGLGPNEVPAILQRGEEVLTKGDARHRRNGGAAGGRSLVTTPIVAIGDAAVADAMAGAAGTNVILTVVRHHWGALSRGVDG